MASLVQLCTCSRVFKHGNLQRSLSTSSIQYKSIKEAINLKEAPQISEVAVLKPKEVADRKKHDTLIEVRGYNEIATISGIPEEHIKTRRVRIYKPAKNAMQSGTDNIRFWQIEFDNRKRWENPLMGWASNGDPVSNMKCEFLSKDDAIAYCEKNGFEWFVTQQHSRLERPKNYGLNFSWNKRTRVSTK